MFNHKQSPPLNMQWTREAIQNRLRAHGSSFDMPIERQVWQGGGGVYIVASEVWGHDRYYMVFEYLPRQNKLVERSASGEFSTARVAGDRASDYASGCILTS